MRDMRDDRPRVVPPARIRGMLATRSVVQVASDLRIDPAEVEAVKNGGAGVILRDNETGREWSHHGWRSAYRRVCMMGLTDWDWQRDAPAGAW